LRASGAGSTEQFCRDALGILARLFRLWYRFRGDLRDRRGNPQPLDWRQLILLSLPLQKQFFRLAQEHLDDAEGEVRNLATVYPMSSSVHLQKTICSKVEHRLSKAFWPWFGPMMYTHLHSA